MDVDVPEILARYGIEYIDRGPNVKKGWVNVKCPLCSHDPSFHMGINLEGSGWGCWRDKNHRGRSLRYLFRRLLRVPDHVLDQILGKRKLKEVSELQRRANEIFGEKKIDKEKIVDRPWPAEIIPIKNVKGPRGITYRHLIENRRYSEADADLAIRAYDLRCCSLSKFSHRVIFPICMEGCRVGWTGRDITGESERRYYTDDGGFGKTLIYAPRIRPTIVLVEGPFDALRLNLAAKKHRLPICSWALLGTAVTSGQTGRLRRMIPAGSNLFIGFDAAAGGQGIDLMRHLRILRPKAAFLPEGVEDPDMLREGAPAFLEKILSS